MRQDSGITRRRAECWECLKYDGWKDSVVNKENEAFWEISMQMDYMTSDGLGRIIFENTGKEVQVTLRNTCTKPWRKT